MPNNCARKLLLIACSSRKLHTSGLLPAIQRYDGVMYRVIRKARREGYFPENVDVKIVSAKFGLIDASTPIPDYDVRMDRQRAEELRPEVEHNLRNMIPTQKYDELFINMGKTYLRAIGNLGEWMAPEVMVAYAAGGIGTKANALKAWLKSRNYDA